LDDLKVCRADGSSLRLLFDSCLTGTEDGNETPASTRHVAMNAAALVKRGGEELLYIQRSLGFLCENLERSLDKLRTSIENEEVITNGIEIGKLIAIRKKSDVYVKVLEEARMYLKRVDEYISDNMQLVEDCRIGKGES
jgi:hypothetical protein